MTSDSLRSTTADEKERAQRRSLEREAKAADALIASLEAMLANRQPMPD